MSVGPAPEPLPVIESLEPASCDYEADLVMPGLSVSAIAPEAWWLRPVQDWIARRIRQ